MYCITEVSHLAQVMCLWKNTIGYYILFICVSVSVTGTYYSIPVGMTTPFSLYIHIRQYSQTE